MNFSNFPPKSSDYWEAMPALYKTFNSIQALMLLIIFALTIKMIIDILRLIRDDLVQSDMLTVITTPFNVALCCALGNIFPRSADFLYSIGLVVLMSSLYRVISLLYNAYGGVNNFSSWLLSRGNGRIRLSVPPMCCCCKCLPSPSATPRNLRRLRWVAMQSPLVRIVVQIILLIMTMEEVPLDSKSNQLVTQIGLISTLFGIYITHVMLHNAKEFLDEHGMVVLLRSADVAQGLYTGLKSIFDLLARNSDFGNTDFMSSEASGNFFFNFAATVLFLILAIVQFIYVRPSRSKLFELRVL
ncbi:unnamed protein product, partial [Mesorhabditis spiculigera]